ncbi:MAG: hypothetical protein KKA63_10775 [Gammaproteobacteria bacterium]|nr:hypothetical protein [Gammaproteobacteria bacterium]
MNVAIQPEVTDTTKTICFPLGHLVSTPAALELLDREAVNASELIQRHQRGDWGDIEVEDAKDNENAIINGRRILSSYQIGNSRLWILTESDRSSTTLLLPEEY